MKERKNKTFKRLPNGAVVKNSPANAGDVRDTIASLGQEDPLDKEMANYSSILARISYGQRSPIGYNSWGFRVRHD